MAAEMHVSSIPVREAIRELVARGNTVLTLAHSEPLAADCDMASASAAL